MREITKTIELEIDGEKMGFLIQKMDAFNGSYLLKVVTEKVLPLIKKAVNLTGGEKENDDKAIDQIFDMLPETLASLDANEMRRIMTMCLQTVSCNLPAGYQPVVDARGNFGVEELEYDIPACLRLTYEVITFNTAGFFGENSLGSILGSLSGSRPTL